MITFMQSELGVIADAIGFDELSPDLCLGESKGAKEATQRRSEISKHMITNNNNTYHLSSISTKLKAVVPSLAL